MLHRAPPTTVILGILALWISTPALAVNRFVIEDTTLLSGSRDNEVRVLGDFDQQTYAFSVHIVYDPAKIRVTGVELGADVAALTPAFATGFDPAALGSVLYGVVFELDSPTFTKRLLGTRKEILKLRVDVVGTGETRLEFIDDPGPPGRFNVMTNRAGETVFPAGDDGLITIRQDRFVFGFRGPTAVAGAPGGSVTAEHFATVAHDGGGAGASAWSISLTVDGGRVTAVDLARTDALGLLADGFERSEVTSGPGNEGAISAVVLSFTQPIRLPRNDTATVARLGLELDVPPSGTSTARLRHVDGLRGAGQPVENVVSQSGADNVPTFEPLEIQVSAGATLFVRGDDNGDGAINISDPQFSLNFQFLGGAPLRCRAASDTNGDGRVNISDPQYSLNFQFLGGPPPPAPFPTCGADDSTLGCVEVSLGCR